MLPANKYIRAMHYRGDEELLYLFNEEDVFYKGSVKVPWEGETYLYNAWENCLEETSIVEGRIVIDMRPSESCILIPKGLGSNWESYAPRLQNRKVKYVETLENFKIGYCRSIDYPGFHIAGQVKQPENFALMKPDFSGFISYETTFELKEFSFAMLEITDAYEGVEVFVNGKSAGIEILPFFQFDITRFCHAGINELRIEVATTLERENKITEDTAPTGITGKIYLAYA